MLKAIMDQLMEFQQSKGACMDLSYWNRVYGYEPPFAQDDTHLINDMLSTLTPREEVVLRMRFGLEIPGREDYEPRTHTQKEVGIEFNVSANRICQIEAKAIRRCRHPSRARKIRHIMDRYN